MMLYGKLLNKEVLKIAKRAGWPIWFCYNDKRKGWRRLSYCRNGFRASESVKRKILTGVARLLEKHKIQATIYWVESSRGFPYSSGDYDKLCIRIPDQA